MAIPLAGGSADHPGPAAVSGAALRAPSRLAPRAPTAAEGTDLPPLRPPPLLAAGARHTWQLPSGNVTLYIWKPSSAQYIYIFITITRDSLQFNSKLKYVCIRFIWIILC